MNTTCPLCALFVFGCIHGECTGVTGLSGKLGETSGAEWQGTHLQGSVGDNPEMRYPRGEFALDPSGRGGGHYRVSEQGQGTGPELTSCSHADCFAQPLCPA